MGGIREIGFSSSDILGIPAFARMRTYEHSVSRTERTSLFICSRSFSQRRFIEGA
ncbi:hypothetical protein DAI22_04g092000 [Oryza sativa Japonica Group]|nr:hypothetical protein DAI22_04g092000 [Oryza sativa Japonica Group]